MKITQALALAAVALPAAFANAAAIPVFSTGQAVPPGSVDTRWTYSVLNSAGATVTGNAVVLSPQFLYAPGFGGPTGNWVTAAALPAQWISTCNSDATFSCLANVPTGAAVTYSTTFSMAGLNTAGAVLNIGFTGDDVLGAVSFNGTTVQGALGSGLWGQLNTFSITNGFLAGLNTLSFVVTNADNFKEGLIARVSGTADPIGTTTVPVPGALVLLVSGLAGLGALSRRRKA